MPYKAWIYYIELRTEKNPSSSNLIVGRKRWINNNLVAPTSGPWCIQSINILILVTFVYKPIWRMRIPSGETSKADCRLKGCCHLPQPSSHCRKQTVLWHVILEQENYLKFPFNFVCGGGNTLKTEITLIASRQNILNSIQFTALFSNQIN